jgi:predicted patatin/cPLA2 family phospholipase
MCINKLTNTDLCLTDFEKLNDLKNLQRRLTTKEKELNNREQVIKRKELELDETTQKLATSKVYILNLEKKINELENSTLLNRQTSTVYLQ